VHVVAQKVAARRQEIQDTLQEAGIAVRTLDLIAPSLEDAFIASVRGSVRDSVRDSVRQTAPRSQN